MACSTWSTSESTESGIGERTLPKKKSAAATHARCVHRDACSVRSCSSAFHIRAA